MQTNNSWKQPGEDKSIANLYNYASFGIIFQETAASVVV